jgi:hypothetical protein
MIATSRNHCPGAGDERGDVYVGPRHGRRYRVVAIGPGSGKVQILALWDEAAMPPVRNRSADDSGQRLESRPTSGDRVIPRHWRWWSILLVSANSIALSLWLFIHDHHRWHIGIVVVMVLTTAVALCQLHRTENSPTRLLPEPPSTATPTSRPARNSAERE